MRHTLFDIGREYTKALNATTGHPVKRTLESGYIPQDGPFTVVQVFTHSRGNLDRTTRVATVCEVVLSTVGAGSTKALEAALEVHNTAMELTHLGEHRLSKPREEQDPQIIGDGAVKGSAQAVSRLSFTLY